MCNYHGTHYFCIPLYIKSKLETQYFNLFRKKKKDLPHLEVVHLLQSEGMCHLKQMLHVFLPLQPSLISTVLHVRHKITLVLQQHRGHVRVVQTNRRLLYDYRGLLRFPGVREMHRVQRVGGNVDGRCAGLFQVGSHLWTIETIWMRG